MNFLLAFIAFNFIVIVHEFGHFIASKWSGVKVQEFSLFFGPKIFSTQRGETVYSIRAIPAGGFVRLEGEEKDSDSSNSLRQKPLFARAMIMLAGPLMNMLVAVLLFSIVFLITGYDTTRIDKVLSDSPGYKSGIHIDDKILYYDGKRIYHPMEVLSFLYAYKGKPAEVILLRGDDRIKTVITPKKYPAETRYLIGYTPLEADGENSNVVSAVILGSSAEKQGLKANDRIIRLNDRTISIRTDISDFMNENKEKPVSVLVLRNGSEVLLKITPVLSKTPEQYNLGIGFYSKRGNIFDIIQNSLIYTFMTVRSVGYSIIWLMTGTAKLSQMMGPVGIFDTISSVVKQSPTASLVILNLLNITAFLSTALGASNLLPIPPADGGRLVLLAIEGVIRKPIPIEKEASVISIGVVFMLILIIFFTYNDILRMFTG